MVFIERRETNENIIISFILRLAVLSQLLPINQTVAILNLIKAIFKKYPNTKLLLENEQDRVVKAPYNYEIEFPERSNGDVTSLWLLSDYMRSYSNIIKEFTSKVFNTTQSDPYNYDYYLNKYDIDYIFSTMFPKNLPTHPLVRQSKSKLCFLPYEL